MARNANQPADDEADPNLPDPKLPDTVAACDNRRTQDQITSPQLVDLRYELLEEIEHGGMGTIFRGRDRQLARDVAIKVLRHNPSGNPNAVEMYANEARVMSYLEHPGVTPIYDNGTCVDGRPYQVMKLVEGETLATILRSRETSFTILIRIFADICETMAFAHNRGVLHLDLKPANVMVGAFGQVYVMDWGVARFEGVTPPDFDNGLRHRMNEALVGTPEYMAPEQARCESLDARSDVFGLGAILCEILIGQTPFKGRTVQKILFHAREAAMNEALAGLEECDTDRFLVRLAKRCLAPKRNDRPFSAVELSREMVTYQETALQRMEGDMNRFFELSLDLFCIADLDGFFRRINSNFQRVLGYSENELLARPFLDFVHESDRAETIAVMGVLSDGQPVVRFRNRYRNASGDYVTLEWTAKSIQEENTIFAVAREISPST